MCPSGLNRIGLTLGFGLPGALPTHESIVLTRPDPKGSADIIREGEVKPAVVKNGKENPEEQKKKTDPRKRTRQKRHETIPSFGYY